MIRFLDSQALKAHPKLLRSVLAGKVCQLSRSPDRDEKSIAANKRKYGEIIDTVDKTGSIYLTSESKDEQYLGSISLSPMRQHASVMMHPNLNTTSDNLVAGTIWECGEHCAPERSFPKIASSLMAASGKFMFEYEISILVAVCDRKLQNFFEAIGASTFVIGGQFEGVANVCVAIWQFSEDRYCELLKRSGLSALEMELYFANAEISLKRSELGKSSYPDIRTLT